MHTPLGIGIAHARVTLRQANAAAAESGASGRFSLLAAPGAATLTIAADGFGATTLERVNVHEGTTLDITLEPLAANALRTIGRVVVDGRLALARGTTASQTLARAELDDEGLQHVTDALAQVPSVTLPRPDAGGPGAVAVVALRGPDPSETLVALDGQVLNNANTGDFDLSQLAVSPFRAIDVTEGLGPENAIAANTIGGEVDFRTIEPTREPHALFALSYGSFGSSSIAANATGEAGRLGYALAFGDAHSQGSVFGQHAPFASGGPAPVLVDLGSAVATQTGLVNLSWSFSPRAEVRVRYFTIADARDESAALDAPLSDGTFAGPGPAYGTQGLRALLVSARAPLGAGALVGSFATSGTTTTFAGGPIISPYDLSYADRLETSSLGWERSTAAFDVAAGGYVRTESLALPNAFASTQAENSAAGYARAAWNAGPHVRLLASLYDTRYSTFGSSLDGRLGASADLDGSSDVRFSIGTGFRPPLLTELYATPLSQIVAGLPGSVDAHCVAANGDPSEKPEHVTTYELGYGRRFGGDTTVDASLYRTNLRDPIEIAYPFPVPPLPPGGICTSVAGQAIPINVSNAVYEGGALRIGRRFGNLFARGEYGVNVAYPLAFPQTVSNPTSGANLVPFQQFEGIPIHVASLELHYSSSGYHAGALVTYRGKNNELNAGPYAVLDGSVGKRAGAVDYALTFQNVTNAAAGRFTRLGGGVPYPTPSGPLPTDLFVLQPAAVNFVVTLRH